MFVARIHNIYIKNNDNQSVKFRKDLETYAEYKFDINKYRLKNIDNIYGYPNTLEWVIINSDKKEDVVSIMRNFLHESFILEYENDYYKDVSFSIDIFKVTDNKFNVYLDYNEDPIECYNYYE